jgi:hypothetical protein
MFGNPVALAKGGSDRLGPADPRIFDISPDGKRFIGVVNTTASTVGPARQIEVILNWFGT